MHTAQEVDCFELCLFCSALTVLHFGACADQNLVAGAFLSKVPYSFYLKYSAKNNPGQVWLVCQGFLPNCSRNTTHHDTDAVNMWTKTLDYAIKHLSTTQTQPKELQSAL